MPPALARGAQAREWAYPVLPSGQLEIDGFECGFRNGEVSEFFARVRHGVDHLRRQPLLDICVDPQGATIGFDAVDSGDPLDPRTRGAVVSQPEGDRDDALRSHRRLQPGGCVERQQLAVVDYGDPLAEYVGFFHVMCGEQDRAPTAVHLTGEVP